MSEAKAVVAKALTKTRLHKYGGKQVSGGTVAGWRSRCTGPTSPDDAEMVSSFRLSLECSALLERNGARLTLTEQGKHVLAVLASLN